MNHTKVKRDVRKLWRGEDRRRALRSEDGEIDPDEVLAECERLGLNAIQACSIIAVGVVPAAL